MLSGFLLGEVELELIWNIDVFFCNVFLYFLWRLSIIICVEGYLVLLESVFIRFVIVVDFLDLVVLMIV